MKTEKAPYRNAVRSRKLIREAFIQLLLKKDVVSIKACEVIVLANISKGTFYAHYTCLYDVQQEIEGEYLSRIFLVFESNPPQLILENFFPLFYCGLQQMERERALFKVLFHSSYGDRFLCKVRSTFLTYMMRCCEISEFFDGSDHARAYLTYVSGGAIALIQLWLESESNFSAQQVAQFLSDCALNGIHHMKDSKKQT